MKSKLLPVTSQIVVNRVFKHDVYGSFSILFMSSLNKSYKNRKVSLTIHYKYKYFDSTIQRAEDRRQKFYFCRLSFAVSFKLNLSNVGIRQEQMHTNGGTEN